MKLLLSSFGPSTSHDKALADLAGKPLGQIRVGYIENAFDVYTDRRRWTKGGRACAAMGTHSSWSTFVSGAPTSKVCDTFSASSTLSCLLAATRTTSAR